MGARMRAFDWSETPLGAPETWPHSLKTAPFRLHSMRRHFCKSPIVKANSYNRSAAFLPLTGKAIATASELRH
jgi:hypothetical protein